MPSQLQKPLKSEHLGRLRGRPSPAVQRCLQFLQSQPAFRPFAAKAKLVDDQTRDVQTNETAATAARMTVTYLSRFTLGKPELTIQYVFVGVQGVA